MPKLSLALMLLILSVVLINLTSFCFAHQPIPEEIIISTSKRYDFSEVGKANGCQFKFGKALMARDDTPEPPPQPPKK
jgi:hypothetical protein